MFDASLEDLRRAQRVKGYLEVRRARETTTMRDVLRVLKSFAGSSVAVRVDGPPRYDSQRVIVEGDPRAFRMLAEVLSAMAETVESDPAIRQTGWRLVFSPDDLDQLRMDNGYQLVLDCDPGRGDAP
jgi:hypothetical protein